MVLLLIRTKFCQDTVQFSRLTTIDGLTPSESILSSIKNSPFPTDITSAQSWFGLMNQASWEYSMSPIMKPFIDLLKPNTKFYWDHPQDTLFHESKDDIIAAVKDSIKSFDPKK